MPEETTGSGDRAGDERLHGSEPVDASMSTADSASANRRTRPSVRTRTADSRDRRGRRLRRAPLGREEVRDGEGRRRQRRAPDAGGSPERSSSSWSSRSWPRPCFAPSSSRRSSCPVGLDAADDPAPRPDPRRAGSATSTVARSWSSRTRAAGYPADEQAAPPEHVAQGLRVHRRASRLGSRAPGQAGHRPARATMSSAARTASSSINGVGSTSPTFLKVGKQPADNVSFDVVGARGPHLRARRQPLRLGRLVASPATARTPSSRWTSSPAGRSR